MSRPLSIVWYTLSAVLILAGVGFAVMGGVLFYAYQTEAQTLPPDTRVIDSYEVAVLPVPTVDYVVTIVPHTTPPSLADNPLPVFDTLPADFAPDDKAVRASPFEAVAEVPPTRITSEVIGLDSRVTAIGWYQNDLGDSVWEVAHNAAGWHQNSALPGEGGNVVLSGHHNIGSQVFSNLLDIRIGETVQLYAGEQQFTYVIVDKFLLKDKDQPAEVRRRNARWIGPFHEERLTLVTCWPFHTNTHRLIIIAKPERN